MALAVRNRGRGGRLTVRRAILAVNAGSSSLKAALFDVAAPDGPQEIARSSSGSGDISEAADRLLDWVEDHIGDCELHAVGHRIVHGGPLFHDAVEIDEAVLFQLEALTPLAPLHQPGGLAPILRFRELRPDLLQFACFDTAFHRTIAPPASQYALPQSMNSHGVRRYGFHGLSYESIAEQLRAAGADTHGDRPSRIIVAHLGSGASLCAMLGLKSVDTTMGFSVLDGLVMGTRPGSLDPGILLYLLKETSLSVGELEHMLYRESGLLGLSGISGDVAVLLASDAREAADALEVFAFQVVRHTAALAATLGGVDRIVFTGGIGEHAPAVVRMITQGLEWLGAVLDDQANESGATLISAPSSSIILERRQTEEELVIARRITQRLSP
jgi:acetate kinase